VAGVSLLTPVFEAGLAEHRGKQAYPCHPDQALQTVSREVALSSPSDEEPSAPDEPPTRPEAGLEPTTDFGPGLDEAIALVVAPTAYLAVDTGESIAPFEPVEIATETPTVADPVAPMARSIADLGDGLGRRLDALQTLFDREIRAESTREKVVDRLHAELQEYKQGLILGILRPVFVDLIRLHDDIGKTLERPDEPELDARRLLDLLRGYRQEVEDILYRQGVEPFDHEGEAFDPRRQRALATVPTEDPARNKHVAARLRKGFQSGDKVIRPEMVNVYAHKPRPPEPG